MGGIKNRSEEIEMKTDEIIQIHIGNGGVQLTNPCWEMYSIEHNIKQDGTFEPGTRKDNPLYSISDDEKVTARAIIIDTEPSSVDNVRFGPYRKLFSRDNLISGKHDSGNIYARGYYRNSRLLIDQITDIINSMAETCTNLQGFIIYRALGGGTGSGLGTKIMEHLDYCFPKILKYEFVLFPSPIISPSIVEVYNSMLTTHTTMDISSCTISFDNDCVHEICLNNLDINGPCYKDINNVIGQVIAAVTSTFRNKGDINFKFNEFNINLVPYPLLHFPMITKAPIYASKYASKKIPIENLSCTKLTKLLFEPKHRLIKFRTNNYFTAMLLYRGNLTPTDINDTIEIFKISNKYFNDIDNISYGLNNMMPTHIKDGQSMPTENDVCLLGNNFSITETWMPIIKKFNRLYHKKAFLYHYLTEGLVEHEFQDAKESIVNLLNEYKELEGKRIEFSTINEAELY